MYRLSALCLKPPLLQQLVDTTSVRRKVDTVQLRTPQDLLKDGCPRNQSRTLAGIPNTGTRNMPYHLPTIGYQSQQCA